MSKYIPPHLRGKEGIKHTPRTLAHAINEIHLNSQSTTKPHSIVSDNAVGQRNTTTVYSTQDVRSELRKASTVDTYQSSQLERHGDLDSEETKYLTKFYQDNSRMFNTWKEVREKGYENQHIASFFVRKRANQEGSMEQDKSYAERKKRKGAFAGASVKRIFEQFYKYAIDIDNGINFSQVSSDFCKVQKSSEKFWFLDFGFAPGGMTDLILQTCPEAYGVGVSLESDKGGNVYLPYLESSPRFHILQGDVIELARNKTDLKEVLNLPDHFKGFDLAIIGITIHQEWEGEDINELKDLLHFSQLYLSFKHLKTGASVLMRMHMSLRLVDCHLLAFMLSSFDPEKSSLNNVTKTVVTKPFSTFSMRKTYWVLYNGFQYSRGSDEWKSAINRLETLLGKDAFGYGWDEEKKDFNKAVLMNFSIEKLLNLWGKEMILVLEQVWEKQVVALQGFMTGKKDILCRYGTGCRRRRKSYREYSSTYNNVCDKAHSEQEIIPEVLAALNAVDIRSKPRLNELGFY